MPGSTPTVDTVMCRAPMPNPCGSLRIVRTVSTAGQFMQRLAHAHEHDVRRQGAAGRAARAREPGRRSRTARGCARSPSVPSRRRRSGAHSPPATTHRTSGDRLRESRPSQCADRRAGGTETSRCRRPTSVATRSRAAGSRSASASAARNAFGSSVISSNVATGVCHRRRTHLTAAIARGSPRATAKSRTASAAARWIEIEKIDFHRKTPLRHELVGRIEPARALFARQADRVARIPQGEREAQSRCRWRRTTRRAGDPHAGDPPRSIAPMQKRNARPQAPSPIVYE